MRTRLILGFAGTLLAFALAIWLTDWQALLAAFGRLSLGVLLLSAMFSIATSLILAARWAMLTAGRDRFGVQQFHDALVGQVFNIITPGAVGSDAYRAVVAGGRDGGRTRAMAMLVLERLLGFGAYAFVFLLSFAINQGGFSDQLMNSAAIMFAAILFGLAGAIIAARQAGWRRTILSWLKFERVQEAVEQIAVLPPWRILSAVALTLAALSTWLLCLGIIAHQSGVLLPAPIVVMIAIITECARLLPISIQGIGVREVTFASLAVQAGGVAAPAFAACATAYALHFLLSGLIGLAARTSFDYRHLRRTG